MRDGSGLSIDRTGHRAAVAAGPTGHSLFGGTVVSIMNLDTMRVVRTIAMPPRFGEAISLAFSPNGKRLAVGSTLGYFSVVDPATGRPVLRPTPISSIRWVLTSLVWTPDGRRVFVGGQAGVLYGFDARTWKLRSKTPLTAEASLTGSAVSPDGSYLVVPSESGQVFKIDPVTGAEQGTPFAVRGTQLQAAAVSGDGSVVAALGRDGRLQLWDSQTQRPLGPACPAMPASRPHWRHGEGRVRHRRHRGAGDRRVEPHTVELGRCRVPSRAAQSDRGGMGDLRRFGKPPPHVHCVRVGGRCSSRQR